MMSDEDVSMEPVEDESQEEPPRRSGRCKWFNVVMGYGFITPDDGGQDVFVHQTAIRMQGFRSLGEGEEVHFQSRSSEKGVEAMNVRGAGGGECRGSDRRPVSKKKSRKIRCYNCGEFANHIAAKCPHEKMPKRCHYCKSTDHLIADCPSKKAGDNGSNQSISSGSFRSSPSHSRSDSDSSNSEASAKVRSQHATVVKS